MLAHDSHGVGFVDWINQIGDRIHSVLSQVVHDHLLKREEVAVASKLGCNAHRAIVQTDPSSLVVSPVGFGCEHVPS